jgi:uncharacterized protein (DUF2384 family)
MAQVVEAQVRREPAMFYRRIERKLGITPLHSDRDLARLVDERLPLASVESLTHDESDRAVRIARISSLAEEVFADDAKASRWLRKPKVRFEDRSPFEMLRTEAGARLVEEMLLQLDYGFAA